MRLSASREIPQDGASAHTVKITATATGPATSKLINGLEVHRCGTIRVQQLVCGAPATSELTKGEVVPRVMDHRAEQREPLQIQGAEPAAARLRARSRPKCAPQGGRNSSRSCSKAGGAVELGGAGVATTPCPPQPQQGSETSLHGETCHNPLVSQDACATKNNVMIYLCLGANNS